MTDLNIKAQFLIERSAYSFRLKKTLVLTLILFILGFSFYRQLPEQSIAVKKEYSILNLTIEDMPKTRQKKDMHFPIQPQIPIASEAEFIPDDETIELTEIDLEEVSDFFTPGEADEDIAYLLVEQDEEERQEVEGGYVRVAVMVNNFGHVDTVCVLENTTSSKKLEMEAIRSAYRMRYILEKASEEAQWFERSFHF